MEKAIGSACTHAQRYLLLIRHPETLKNQTASFGGGLDDDITTRRGDIEEGSITAAIRDIRELLPDCCSIAFYASSRPRATRLFDRVSALRLPVMAIEKGFDPIGNGSLAGMPATEVERAYPVYADQLKLYRDGLLSLYQVTSVGEPLPQFERRVSEALACLSRTAAISVVVTHKSTIGAVRAEVLQLPHQLLRLYQHSTGYGRDDLSFTAQDPRHRHSC
jgi:broad specificity phosphatase PhoE